MEHRNIPRGEFHGVANWSVASIAERDVLVVTAADTGKQCWVRGIGHFVLESSSPMAWEQVVVTAPVLETLLCDVRNYGGISAGTTAANTIALLAAVAAAVIAGHRRVLIPFDAWAVTPATDCNNCEIIGNGVTYLTGAVNVRKYSSCKFGAAHTDYVHVHPAVIDDKCNKLIVGHDANTAYAFVEKATTGYQMLILKNNSTTVGSLDSGGKDSLSTTTSDQTQWRLTQSLDAVEVLTAHTTPTSESIAFTEVNMTVGVPAYDSGTALKYLQSDATAAWIEFTVAVPEDGHLSVGFLKSAASSTDVTIRLDGNDFDASFSNYSSTTQRSVRNYIVEPGEHDVRIINNDVAGTYLNVLGLYFAPLRAQHPQAPVDSWGVYRNSLPGGVYLDPLDSNSANDYAIKDAGSSYTYGGSTVVGVYGGSYHGGESGHVYTLYVNGVEHAIIDATLFAFGQSIHLIQESTITWSGAKPAVTYSGATVHVYTVLRVCQGGCSFAVTLDGDLTAKEFYTVLVGVNDAYTHINVPQKTVLTDIGDMADDRCMLGNNTCVEYEYAPTGQRLRIEHSSYSMPESKYGGAMIWYVAGSYAKYYYPYVHTGKRAMTALHAVVNIIAS